MRRRLLLLALLLILPAGLLVPADAEPEEARLVVEVAGLRNLDGTMRVSLYDRAEGFPRDRKVIFRNADVDPIESDPVVVVFDGIAPGEYAVALLHDEDRDGEMTSNFIGWPKEGYGFSNNVRPKLKAPSFEKTKFVVGPGETRIRIDVIYR